MEQRHAVGLEAGGFARATRPRKVGGVGIAIDVEDVGTAFEDVTSDASGTGADGDGQQLTAASEGRLFDELHAVGDGDGLEVGGVEGARANLFKAGGEVDGLATRVLEGVWGYGRHVVRHLGGRAAHDERMCLLVDDAVSLSAVNGVGFVDVEILHAEHA